MDFGSANTYLLSKFVPMNNPSSLLILSTYNTSCFFN